MSEVETLKGGIRKLFAKAMRAKMDLHDPSCALPVNLWNVLDAAKRAHDASEILEQKRAELTQLETA
jgi:hypothetical protein